MITFIKPKGRKQYMCCFLRYQILRGQNVINYDEYCCHVKQVILASANSYCNFRIFFIYYVLYFPVWTSKLYFPCFPFVFYCSHLKAGTVHSSDSSLIGKRSIISQLHVQAATAKNEEQYTLNNVI